MVSRKLRPRWTRRPVSKTGACTIFAERWRPGLQRLGVRLEVTEAVLNHISGSRAGVVGVYQRHDWADEKRAALNAWGEHVAAIVEGREAAGNVTPLRRGA